MKNIVISIATGVLLAVSIAPAMANGAFVASPKPGWVTYWVQLYYQPLTDGPNLPVQIVPYTMYARNIEAAKEVCAHSLINLSRYLMDRSIRFHREMYAGGGRCVTDKSGAIKFAVVGNTPAGNH